MGPWSHRDAGGSPRRARFDPAGRTLRLGPAETYATRELHELKYKQPPWSVKYPELLGILEDEPLAPKGNVVARNVCWDGPWGWTEPKAQPYVKFQDNLVGVDPSFAGKPPADFRLAPDSPALKLGFRPNPLEKIGVYRSDDRASWPVEPAPGSAPGTE